MSTNWSSYKGGDTLGTAGSEEGVTLQDETYRGLRITLERDARHIPFAITCGIAGWMVHTCYFSTEQQARAAYEEMKSELVRIYDMVPDAEPEPTQEQIDTLCHELDYFIHRFNT